MTRCLTICLALAALCSAPTFAQARPPTVTVSPGYDARLKESRSALSGAPTTVTTPKHSKKRRAH